MVMKILQAAEMANRVERVEATLTALAEDNSRGAFNGLFSRVKLAMLFLSCGVARTLCWGHACQG